VGGAERGRRSRPRRMEPGGPKARNAYRPVMCSTTRTPLYFYMNVFIIKYINEVNNDPMIITITICGIVFVWYDLFLYSPFPSVPGIIINFGVIVQNIKKIRLR
jgi:hypothetical protein